MRLPDWDRRLIAYIEEVRHKPFCWGQHDCFTFAVKCEEAISGVTRFPELYKAKYYNKFGANKAFIKNGYRGMIDCINRRCIQTNPDMLQRGDWAAFDTPDGLAIGVDVGGKIAAAGFDGLVFIELKDAKAGWSI
jgi:hypothetical protein